MSNSQTKPIYGDLFSAGSLHWPQRVQWKNAPCTNMNFNYMYDRSLTVMRLQPPCFKVTISSCCKHPALLSRTRASQLQMKIHHPCLAAVWCFLGLFTSPSSSWRQVPSTSHDAYGLIEWFDSPSNRSLKRLAVLPKRHMLLFHTFHQYYTDIYRGRSVGVSKYHTADIYKNLCNILFRKEGQVKWRLHRESLKCNQIL